MNLGSPDSPEVKDVRRYLNEFLMDERVIDIPYLLRLLLVKGIITPFRASKSSKAYQSIWTSEGSPLIVLSKQLQKAYQQQTDMPVALAMRYGNPTPKAAFDELLRVDPAIEEVIAVPLYPHYAMSSYETAVEHARQTHKQYQYKFKLSFVAPFYNNTDYIQALSESIRPHLQEHFDHVLFSYHGIPERHIHKADITRSHCLSSADCCIKDSPAHAYCYRHQCFDTTERVATQLNIPKGRYSVSFQSRLGRDEWLKPYTAQRLKEMPAEGIKKLVIVCPAFISDCLETLEEIAEEGKEIFLHAGGEHFTIVPCLNVNPLWVQALDKLVREGKKLPAAPVLQQ